MSDVVVELPRALREALREPAGPVYTGAETLLADAGDPLVTVGDVVTYHVLEAGVTPAVALVDDRTERSAVDAAVADRVADATFDCTREVSNPAAALTAELLSALAEAIATEETTLLVVDGEEDLATLPAVVAAPEGAGVVYGQPGEGMVLVSVDDTARTRMRELLARMDGNTDRLVLLLDS